jgi:hypothetical protein
MAGLLVPLIPQERETFPEKQLANCNWQLAQLKPALALWAENSRRKELPSAKEL